MQSKLKKILDKIVNKVNTNVDILIKKLHIKFLILKYLYNFN